MHDLTHLVDQAKRSMLFTAPRLENDLRRFLEENAKRIRELAEDTARSSTTIYWVGSGNSWCNLYSGKYLLDRYSTFSSECLTSYELIWRRPARLGPGATVILASFSGSTEDTVEALRFAKSQGAKTIAVTSKAESPLAREADETILYESDGLFVLPLAMAYLFSMEIANSQGALPQGFHEKIQTMPDVLGRLFVSEESRARRLAETHADAKLFYVLASGPLYGLGYKFALTVFMENMRVHGSFMETSEFRHGPVEMLDREDPVIVMLKGTDESRDMSERVQALVEEYGAKTILYDYADYEDSEPLFAPFYLMVPLQWFAVYSSLLRGITDLDERAIMGRGRMSRGADITWP